MVQQNIAICIGLAAVGGIFGVLAKVVVIIPYDREKNGGPPTSQCWKTIHNLINAIIQGIQLFLIYPASTWFGPVSIYCPTAVTSKLFSNMIIIGGIMRRGTISKSTQVATCSLVLAVVLLPAVGPATQENQDIGNLLKNPIAITWIVLLSIVFVLSFAIMLFKNFEKMRPVQINACLLGVSICCNVLTGTISKGISNSEGPLRIVLVVLFCVINGIWIYENIVEATAVASLVKFVPLYVAGSLATNALTGIIVWEDWKVVASWAGYVSVLLQMIFSLYLMSDLEFLLIEKATKRSDGVRADEAGLYRPLEEAEPNITNATAA